MQSLFNCVSKRKICNKVNGGFRSLFPVEFRNFKTQLPTVANNLELPTYRHNESIKNNHFA
jgi:hypothetical protein